MRTVSGPESALLGGRVSAHSLKIEIQNAAAAWIDYSAYLARDWQDRCEITADVNQRVAEATVEIGRSTELGSLSPLMNTEIATGRLIRISGSRVAVGSAASWKKLFQGRIDRVDWAADPMKLIARDDSGMLVDRWVEQATSYPYPAGEPIQDVMQAILDQYGDGMVLYAPVSPGFMITAYDVPKKSVLDALQTLADAIGWVIEYRWDDGTSAFRLTFYEPDRTPGSTQWTFGPDDYYEVSRLDEDSAAVRNAITVLYRESTTGTRASVTAEDSPSIARYGRQWADFEEADDSPIDTLAEATALLDAALADLKSPGAEQEIEVDLFWPVQLGDYYEFLANGVHYGTDQEFGVTGYTHVFENGKATTRLQARGKPVGHVQGWLQRIGTLSQEAVPSHQLSIVSVQSSADPSGAGVLVVNLSDAVRSFFVAARVNQDPTEDEILAGLKVETVTLERSVTVQLGRGNVGDVLHFGVIAFADLEGIGRRTSASYAQAPVVARPLSSAPEFSLVPLAVGTAASVKAILVSDPDGTMRPWGAGTAGAYVRFRRVDTGAVQTDDTPVVTPVPRPEYQNGTTYSVASSSVDVDVYAYYWRTRSGDPVELFLGRITLAQNPLAEVGPGYADWHFTGKIRYRWKYDAQTTRIRFAARRSAPWPNNAATRNLLIAGGTDLSVATYGDPTQATLTFLSGDDNPRPGESIYVAAIGYDVANVPGPLSVGQSTRAPGGLGEAFTIGGDALGREVPGQYNPVTGELISGTGTVQNVGYPFVWLGGGMGSGVNSARVKVSRTVMPADELTIDPGVTLLPTAYDTGNGIAYVDHGFEATFPGVNPGPADAHAKAVVGGFKLSTFSEFTPWGAELRFTDLMLAGQHERLYVRAWPMEDPLGLTGPGPSVAKIIYGLDATLSLSFADWKEQGARSPSGSPELVSEFYLYERSLEALNYVRLVVAVSATSAFTGGDLHLQVVYLDSAGAVVQPGNPYISRTWDASEIIGEGRPIVEIQAHQIPTGAVRAQVYLHSSGDTNALTYGSFQGYAREAPSPTGQGVAVPGPTTYEQAVAAAGQAAGLAVAAALAYSSTDETGAAVVAAPIMDVTNTIPLITAERAATPDLNVGTGAYSDDETLDDVRAVLEAGVADAILAASDAQATADGKVTTFIQASPPTADAVGDLWFDNDDGNKPYRWNGSAWVATQDASIATAQALATTKIVSFFQASAPTATATGDLWFDSDDTNKQYRWSGSVWASARDAGKTGTFYATSAPTAEAVGDVWYDSDDDNKQYRWSGSAWVSVQDAGIAAAQAGQGSAGTPLPPSGGVWSPGYTGQGDSSKDDNTCAVTRRTNWTPFLFSARRMISTISIETGAEGGSPTGPTGRILIATMRADRLAPGTVLYASSAFAWTPNSLITVTGVNFTPIPGTYYVVGVTSYGADLNPSDYATLHRWGDPVDSLRQLPIETTGGDASLSAGFGTDNEFVSPSPPFTWPGGSGASIAFYGGESALFYFELT